MLRSKSDHPVESKRHLGIYGVRDPRRAALVEEAIRSSGGTNFELLSSVVVLTKSMIAFFADPSFHEASGSAPAAETAEPADGVEGAGVMEQPARMRIEKTNVERDARWIFIFLCPLHLLDWSLVSQSPLQ